MLRSPDWPARAAAVLPAGGFGNFDPGVVIREGQGARVTDEEGRDHVDLLIGSGPMLLGHGHPEVLEAVAAQLPKGMTFFTGNARGIELAEAIVEAVPCAEQIRYVSTGGEADMYAIRLARAHTGRTKILKFEGGYHGMSAEAQMSLSPSRLVNFPQAVPDSAGIPESVGSEVLVAPFNDAATVTSLMAEHGHQIAAIIVEPLQRIVPPEPGFLQCLRDLCTRHGAMLVFDEVVTGFRLARGGGQEAYGVTPDICTLGKVIGGGFPLAAIAGPEAIMRHFDRAAVGAEGWLMQIGTLSGNPVAAVAGLKTLEILDRPGARDRLEGIGRRLMQAMSGALETAGVPHRVVGHPTLFEIVFTQGPVRDWRDTQKGDADLAARWNAGLRAGGILKSPGKVYPSLALTEDDLQQVEAAARESAAAL